jgi:hypothetical protein
VITWALARPKLKKRITNAISFGGFIATNILQIPVF